jgi:hypothetical protein
MLRLSLVQLVVLGALWPRGAAAAEPPTTAEGAPVETSHRSNRAPKFNPAFEVLPTRSTLFGSEHGKVRVGRTSHIVVHANDPDEDALKFSVDPLPAGATIDVDTGTLSWRPTAPGRQQFEFTVTDGSAVARRSIMIVVGPNRAPAAVGRDVLLALARADGDEVGEGVISTRSGSPVIAHDPDGDPVTIRVLKLPSGATLEKNETEWGVSLHWRPTEAQVGEHEIAFVASDGERTTEFRRRVRVLPEWSAHDSVRWVLPGGGPATFLTHADGELFVGGAFDVSLAAKRSGLRAARCGTGGEPSECAASRHRFYAEFEVLDSMRAGSPSLFTYGLGFSASLEWNPARRYLIPHYGVEIGGLVRSELGHRAAVRPYLGTHLFASDDWWLNAVLGYRVVPAELVDLSGPTLGVKLVLAPW